MAYHRKGDKNLLILANLKQEEETVPIPSGSRILLNTTDGCRSEEGLVRLEGWQGLVLELFV